MKVEFQVLTGSFSNVYFHAVEKGNWKTINFFRWLWLTITYRMTRINKQAQNES